jgi:hypothetical protein
MADYRDNVVACLTAMADAMRFREVCESGKFYDLLADIAGISRKQAKIEVFATCCSASTMCKVA